MSDWSDHDNDDLDFVSSGDDDDGEQRLSSMFHQAKSKGVSEDSYADWQAIVAKECESCDGRNFSFKASKRIFRIELARADFATAQATFERLVSFIPAADVKAVHKAFLSRGETKICSIGRRIFVAPLAFSNGLIFGSKIIISNFSHTPPVTLCDCDIVTATFL